MRVIIAGSRRHTLTHEQIDSALAEAKFRVTTLVCGMAPGVDSSAWEWAKARKIPIDEHPARWSEHGDAAGPIRNREMCAVADALLAFPSDDSRGTKNCISAARSVGLIVHVSRLLLTN